MKKRNNRLILESFSMVSQFSINMLVPIGLCVALGVWLGDKYDIDWIVIPLFFLGAAAGFNNIYQISKKFLKNPDGSTKKENDVKKN